MAVTTALLVITTITLILYDIFAVIHWGSSATISQVLLRDARNYPIIPFALGVLFGHLFFPN